MKTILVTIFTFLFLTSFGQKFKTNSSIELGWTNPYYKIEYSDGYHFDVFTSPKSSMYADIMLKLSAFKYITIQNNLETYFVYNTGIAFSPFMSIYTFQIFGTYKWVEIGYKHQCIHPVISNNENMPLTLFSGKYDKLYVKFTLF
jgi:hypothetical protein